MIPSCFVIYPAVLLLMFNKAALSSYNFPCANVITLFQIMCSCTLLYALRRWKIISFTVGGESQSISVGRSMILVPFKTLVKTLPLALSYLFYMVVTMESVRGINVPMYTTLRRTTVAFTMIAEYLLTGQTHSPFVVASVGMIILGAVVAGSRDLSFDTYSYAVVFVANICTALYLAFIARIGKSSGLNTFGLMWGNMWASFATLDNNQGRCRNNIKFPLPIFIRLPVCDASLLYNGFLDQLLCISKYNSQFSTDTNSLWMFLALGSAGFCSADFPMISLILLGSHLASWDLACMPIASFMGNKISR
ncbi:UDP-sugar transporter sqv-7-like isoform X2 [Cucumis melo var. makuwa]|uniref:UDP-sugar transporter sqv-7-like isoform X2 n=1 Tax=Cucumis melo var. makuwa TaxID=1194695 RepID=A0A5A7VAT4_CUCMM|nr:UDP-sugar transporter sqv-7-like isoform X2 [Cucumis melo var. makuwa]TYJ97853.1 UDP-sugar transporter sqv-7-like isoform X2 [Cucumis melo var. makuwa]